MTSLLLSLVLLGSDPAVDRATFDAMHSSWPDGARIAEWQRLSVTADMPLSMLVGKDPSTGQRVSLGVTSSQLRRQSEALSIRGQGGSPYARLTTCNFGPKPSYSCWLNVGKTPSLNKVQAK